MVISQRNRVLLAALAIGLVALGTDRMLPAGAFPSTSPSAVAAVRLKYHPPDNWIRHYLGDDRYKIAGQIWKVVSTQTDPHYHRANCPNMLRQSAGVVIGFVDADDAESSGYAADGYCSPRAANVTYAAGDAGDGTTVNRSKKAMRIVLADGKSTVMLPPNWKRTRTGAQTVLGYALQSDTLQPLKGQGSLRFAFINAPAGLNVEPLLHPDKFSQLVAVSQKNAAVANYLKDAKISSGTLGGRSGVAIVPNKTTTKGEVGGRVTVVGKNSAVYILENSGNAAGSRSIISSFRPQ